MSGPQLVEGIDYTIENGLMVFTAHYLRRRGYCCESGCRNCPWDYRRERRAENAERTTAKVQDEEKA